ncbi:MAG TPA: amidohydrolase family protein [Usitatibacter sp.]|nr:amidohydrolase family protein [Usitatibacter sp.]
MKRRDVLAFAGASVVSGCHLPLTMEQGLMNPCRTSIPASANALMQQAWSGLDADRVWDVHTHLFGNGRSGGGIWVEPDYDRPSSVMGRVRHAFFKNAGCAGDNDDQLDQGMVARLVALADQYPKGARFMLLAFDFTVDDGGVKREDLTTFSVPNAYARRIAQMRPDRFEWIASIHPSRSDAVPMLEEAKAQGARAVKWLPPTMGIDLRSPGALAFYEALARLDVPLLVHLGEEQAVAGARRHELANPLFIRVALERGVRVIAAHCASLGKSPDLEANPNADKAPMVANFDLFARLMSDKRYDGRLFGDISAITQVNRAEHLAKLLSMRAWDGRLLNGSDYPLPGLMPLFSLARMVSDGLLDERLVPALRDLREANALLFDFTLKRNLKSQGTGFPLSTFETRDFFRG